MSIAGTNAITELWAKCKDVFALNTGTKVFYGTCDTAGTTQRKDVTCAGFTSAELVAGTILFVRFTYGQTYNGYPRMKVGSAGIVTIKYAGELNAGQYEWGDGEIVCFLYDGSFWVIVDGGKAGQWGYGAVRFAPYNTSKASTMAVSTWTLHTLVEDMFVPYAAYSESSTYAVGDRVRYDWYAWECSTAITTPEAWNSSHWTKMQPLQTQIDGKAAASHSHAASAISSGTLDIARIPTGSTSTTVALGNHTHSGYQSQHASTTASLTVNGWSSNSQTANVTGVTASNDVIVSPAPTDAADWAAAGIVCTAQGAGTLTFSCETTPTSALTANVIILS